MIAIKHKLLGLILVLSVPLFSQVTSQKATEKFSVNENVIVEINADYSNVKVEFWNKNSVSVASVLEVDGVSKEEASSYFDSWNIEVLGNSKKVTITSKPKSKHDLVYADFDFSDLAIVIPEMDFEPIIAYSFKFDSVAYPTPPEMPEIVIEQLHKIEWDQEAYEKDKEKYLKEFELRQQEWALEFEEKLEPQMKEFEIKMEKWGEEFEEKYEPQMEEYAKKMEVWAVEFENNFEPKMEEFEREIEIKVIALEEEISAKKEGMNKIKKTILIKTPKNTRVRINSHNGSIELPDGIKKI